MQIHQLIKLFLLNLGLMLVSFAPIHAQSPTPSAVQLPVGCGLNGLQGYIDQQLTGLGFNTQQIQTLSLSGTNIMAATEQIAMQTIMWPNTVTGPHKYNYAQICPECLILYTLDSIWYNGINNIQPQPWGDLKKIDTQLSNAINGNICLTDTQSGKSQCSIDNATCSNGLPIVPCTNVALSQANCGALFSCENIFCLPYAYGSTGGSIGLCEEVIYQTQLYNNLLAIAQAKAYAYQQFCFLPQYASQYSDLPTCINTMAQNMIKDVIKPGSLTPSKATPLKAITDVSNIIMLLNTFNGWFQKLQLCCQAASTTCEAQYGTDYSLSAMAKTIQQSQFAHLAQTKIALNLAYPVGLIWALGFNPILSNGGQASLINNAWQNIEAACGAFTWSNLPSDPIDIVPTGPCGLNLVALANLPNPELVFTNQLFIAIQIGDLTNVQSNIQYGANLNATDSSNNNMTPLMYAANATNASALAILQYLLTLSNINIYAQDSQEHTALWYAQSQAASPQKTSIIQTISTAQLIYDITSNYNSNTIANITADLAAGASLTTPDSTGKSALMYAITNPGGANSTTAQIMEIFNTVLTAAVNQNLIQKNNNPNLSNVIAPMTVPILIYVLQNSALAYISQYTGILQSLLKVPNIDVTATDSAGDNLLIHAAYANYTNNSMNGLAYQIVLFLLNVPNIVNQTTNNTGINAIDNSGYGAYSWAQSSQNNQANNIQQAIASAGGTT
jgi:hypothetical protein